MTQHTTSVRELVVVDPTGRLTFLFENVANYLPGYWEVHSAADQAGATVFLGAEPVDAVVSAIPPNRGGDSFLEWLRLRYPTVLRIAVSDAPTVDESLEATKYAHRTLSSSTPAPEIARWIGRSVAMRDRIQDEDLLSIAGKIRRIPTMPRIYRQLQAVMANPDFGISEVAAIIGRDPGLSVDVLRLINSAYFGLRREITSVPRAVSLLGAETVMSLVLGLTVKDQFRSTGNAGISIDAEWGRALEMARIAHGVAKAERLDKETIDASYLGALLHNVGRLVLAENYPDRFAGMRLQETDLPGALQAERETFGADHSQLGALLLKSWDLPEPIVEAVAFYAIPSASYTVDIGPLFAVHVAASMTPGPGLDLDAGFFESFDIENPAARWVELASPIAAVDDARNTA